MPVAYLIVPLLARAFYAIRTWPSIYTVELVEFVLIGLMMLWSSGFRADSRNVQTGRTGGAARAVGPSCTRWAAAGCVNPESP